MEAPIKTPPQPRLKLESSRDDRVYLIIAYGKEDKSTGLSYNRGVGGVGGVEGSEVIERRSRTRAVRLPQRLPE